MPDGSRFLRAPGAPPARRGFALVSMLVVLVLLALLELGVSHLALGGFRRASDTRAFVAAREAADYGAYQLLRDWEQSGGDTLRVGGHLALAPATLAGGRANARVMRLGTTTWWTVAEGEWGDSATGTLARRRVHVVLRLAIPDLDVGAALTVRDSVTLSASALVSGSDTVPAGWLGCAAPAPGAAVALPDTTRLCDGTCGLGALGGRAVGLPPLLADSSAASPSRYATFGAEQWATLTANASIVLPAGSIVTPAPVVIAGRCDRSLAGSWGDPGAAPGSPCAEWFPMIWARGDVEMRGGVGQGVLLADGDVTLSAGARFTGVVIARDDILSAGSGGSITGAALAGDARTGSGDHTQLAGTTRVRWSRCATERALERSARPLPVRGRSWGVLP